MTVHYLDLTDSLAIAAEVTALDATCFPGSRTSTSPTPPCTLPAQDGAGEDFYPAFTDKAAVLVVRYGTASLGSVHVSTMLDAYDDHLGRLVVDAVEDPVGPTTRRPQPCQPLAQRLADSAGLLNERGREEVDHRCSDRLG